MGLTLDGQPVEGRRLLLERPARQRLELDGVPIPMVPGLVGGVRVEITHGGRPDGAKLDALAGFSRRIGRVPSTFAEASQCALFFHDGLWRDLLADDADAEIVRVIGPLHRIAARPRTRLREEEVVVPVERVRRIARHADRHLTRSGRHIHGGLYPRPTHLLARLLEDDYALIENRAVVTLSRHLLVRARRRLASLLLALEQLRRLGEELDQLKEAGLHKRWGHWRRMAGFDGRDGRLGEILAAGDSYRRQLDQQTKACQAVLDGPLGQALREEPDLHGSLPDSNIFAHDEDYAAVARLWRQWTPGAEMRPFDSVHDDPDRAYTRFVRLLVAQALAALHFTGGRWPLEDADEVAELADPDHWWVQAAPIRGGIRLAYRHYDPEQKRQDEAVNRHPPKPKMLNIVGIFDDFTERPTGEDIVWLHPVETLDDPIELRATGLTPSRPGGIRPPAALPAAPWLFGSRDSLVRLLRGRFLGDGFQQGRMPQHCPVCGGATRQAGPKPDDRVCLERTCGASYGRRQCACGTWIPKLLPGERPQELRVADQRRRRLLDVLVGGDGLADLCPAAGPINIGRMICPGCGSCGADEATRAQCMRCRG